MDCALTPEEEAARIVNQAILHARGDCNSRRAQKIMNEIFEELVQRGVFIEYHREDWTTATLQRKPGERLGAAVFRHVLRETNDAQLAESAAADLARTLGGHA